MPILYYYHSSQSSGIISFLGFVLLCFVLAKLVMQLWLNMLLLLLIKKFFVDWLANCSVENDILCYLQPLGMQKCEQGLKDLAQAVWMLHGGP